MAVNTSTQLGCGRDIDEVWDHVDSPPTPHEASCPFCGAARASLQELATVTTRLRTQDEDDPELQAGPQVIARILEVARSEVRRGQRLPLSKPLPGQVSEALTISQQAVAAVVRRTGDRHGGVQVRRCSVDLVDEPGAPGTEGPDAGRPDAEVTGGRVASDLRVSLRVSVASRVSIPSLSRELRAAVRDVVGREVGMNVVRVDLVVEDVHDV